MAGEKTTDTDAAWPLIRRIGTLVWAYRWGCIRVILVQVLLLALGLSGLGLMGVGVDHVRHHLALRSASWTLGAMPAGDGAVPIPAPKPPHWPFGLTPPESWPPMRTLGFVCAAILVFAAVRSMLNMSYAVMVNRLLQVGLVVELRAMVYRKMQRLSFRFFDENASGGIINRVTGDVQAVRGFVDGVVVQSIILALSLASYLVYMLNIHVGLTAACLATTPLIVWVTMRFSRSVRPAYRRNRDLFDDQILALSESVRGMNVVKGFARHAEQIAIFDAAADRVRDQKRWIFGKVSSFNPLIGLFTQANLVVLLAFGGYLAVRYEMAPDPASAALAGVSVGELLVFAGLLQQFSGQVANIATIADSMQQSLASARRVFEVLDAAVEIRSPDHPVPLPRIRGDVAFENVSFEYRPGAPALRDVSFKVAGGQCIAVLGATGSGKSTLLSLIPRFYDTTAGRILVDGLDVRDVDIEDLRRSIGIVFQESFLFSNTIRANIAFGAPEAPARLVEKAARIAAAHDFITALPNGYDTVLTEGGSNLSGGQRQRLAIARAVLLDPAILLLDDPTAAIDPETESEILQAMAGAMAGRTSFIVAHRLSTLRRADLVLVLDRGRIVQSGTHEELMEARGHYRRAARLQLPDEATLRLLMGQETAES